MTQLTMVLGLAPLALNLGGGGDMLVPMAVAVIGGLLYSLLLSLFFLPAAYCAARQKSTGAVTEVSPSQIEGFDLTKISTENSRPKG